MDFLTYTLWLFNQVFHAAALYFWPVTIPIVLALAFAIILDLKARREALLKRAPFICLPMLLPIAIIVVGSALENKTDYDTLPAVLFIGTCLLSIYTVAKNWHVRKSAIAANLLIIWIGLLAAFTSTMSISNDWL